MNIHAVSHSLPHRGPGASRTRTRWQPYASNLTLSGISRSPSVYLHTPASSVSSASPQTIHLPSICDTERPKPCLQPPPLASSLRENLRAKYAARLVGEWLSSSLLRSSLYRAGGSGATTRPSMSPCARIGCRLHLILLLLPPTDIHLCSRSSGQNIV